MESTKVEAGVQQIVFIKVSTRFSLGIGKCNSQVFQKN